MDEWEAADQLYISDQHHIIGLSELCDEGCDWCLGEIDPNWDKSDN